ncbi:hypothetical protein [Streptomyces californicus]|uniref:hypothetical protein n=1 Tax=Streptomyces californicus TaxID=67351 RepID=UPI0036B825A9
MLQCTTVTRLPPGEALSALRGMRGGPDDADDLLADTGFVLCELGVHEEATEHAARLWTAELQPPEGLWFLWSDTSGLFTRHRFTTLTLCPVRHIDVREGSRQWCNLYEDHPGAHGFHVRDPLKDLLHARIRFEAQRRFREGEPDEDGPGQDDPAEHHDDEP